MILGRRYAAQMAQRWTLLSTHGMVLFQIGLLGDPTMRRLAEDLNLTERRISQIIRELSESGVLQIARRGRRNVYTIAPGACLAKPFERASVAAILSAVKAAT